MTIINSYCSSLNCFRQKPRGNSLFDCQTLFNSGVCLTFFGSTARGQNIKTANSQLVDRGELLSRARSFADDKRQRTKRERERERERERGTSVAPFLKKRRKEKKISCNEKDGLSSMAIVVVRESLKRE